MGAIVALNRGSSVSDGTAQVKGIYRLVLDGMRPEYGVLGHHFRPVQPGFGQGKAPALLHAALVKRQPLAQPRACGN